MTFKNWQWAVTDYGLEAIGGATSPTIRGETPTYEFSTKRLAETTERRDETFYDWPVHMAEKTWVDVEAFNKAFEQAIEFHKGRYSPAVDRKIIEASFKEAKRVAKGWD